MLQTTDLSNYGQICHFENNIIYIFFDNVKTHYNGEEDFSCQSLNMDLKCNFSDFYHLAKFRIWKCKLKGIIGWLRHRVKLKHNWDNMKSQTVIFKFIKKKL